MTKQQLDKLTTEGAAIYLPAFGPKGIPVIAADRLSSGDIWILSPGESFHVMPIRDKKETESAGLFTWTFEDGTAMMALVPLELCDELNRATVMQQIAEQRQFYEMPEAKRWLEDHIKEAERAAKKPEPAGDKPPQPQPDESNAV